MELLKTLFIVGSGSFVGGVVRYLVSLVVGSKGAIFSVSVLLVNILGSFVAGCLVALVHKNALASPLYLLLMVGFCGGFTTFSAFSVDILDLIRRGMVGWAMLGVVSNVTLSIIAAYVGYMLFR